MRDGKILVTRRIPQKFVERLETLGEVEMWDHELTPMPREKFIAAVQDKTAILVTLSEKSMPLYLKRRRI